MTNEDQLIISASSYFDSEWYLARYPDVKKAGIDPAEHYLKHGANEMRDPGPLFDTDWYLAHNSDVSAMKLNPLIHFISVGAKEGRCPNPYALLRKKVIASDQEVNHLFDKYAKSEVVRPGNASLSDWEAFKPKWKEYFLSKGAIAYNFNDTQKSLQCFKSAIQISPDTKDSYLMYCRVFNEYNHSIINAFEHSYASAKLIIAHVSCRERVSLAEGSASSFYDQSNQIRNVTVIGDPSLPEYKFDFNPELNLLKVPSGDSYETVPVKIGQFFSFLGLTSLEVPVLKIDDDIYCKNMGNLKRDLDQIISKHDYGGGVVVPPDPFFKTNSWHLNKCTDPKINDRPDGLPVLAPYVTGPHYWLGSQSVNALSKMALIHERYFETEILEDRAVGTVLAYYGFHAHQFNLIDSGSLKCNEYNIPFSQISALPNPISPKILPKVRLFAILGTWMEADIIEATVQNAMMQGCERVYLVDNDSPDDTVEVAHAHGAICARSFRTERYDEVLRLRHMNDVVCEVSENEPDQHLWWLFIDGDEFPHGPWGMTLLDYLRTLDQQFRVVGARFFNHYPGTKPHYLQGRYPLDLQPLCEEISLPMCASGHRKHPLLRYDKGAALVESDRGFHLVRCADPLYEPLQPIFLHHFPFREENITRRRLEMLWDSNERGYSRADASQDTTCHMLARFRSLDAVYSEDWAKVVNFVPLDPSFASMESPSPPSGVTVRNWEEMVEPVHQPVLRWYSMQGVWNYDRLTKFAYGDDVTYLKGIEFLDGPGTIEDWGCGFEHAKSFVKTAKYIGVDGSSPSADKNVDLAAYVSDTECIFMRHVLEHNSDWRLILKNAVSSFSKRMVLVIFTPFGEITRTIAISTCLTSFPVPDISFKKNDITDFFSHMRYAEESLLTRTQYGIEHIFYIEKPIDAVHGR